MNEQLEQSWTLEHYGHQTLDGWQATFCYLAGPARRLLEGRKAAESAPATGEDDLEAAKSGRDRARLTYALRFWSKLLATMFLFVPAHMFDLNVGQRPSNQFIALHTALIFSGFLPILLVTELSLGSTIRQLLPTLDGRLVRLLSSLASLTELGYLSFGPICFLYLMLHRRRLYLFIVNQCADIQLAKQTQRLLVLELHTLGLLLNALGEPVFFATAVSRQFAAYTGRWSLASQSRLQLASLAVWLVSFAFGLVIGMAQLLFTQLTCLLSVALAEQLAFSLEHETSRLRGPPAASTLTLDWPRSPHLELSGADGPQVSADCLLLTYKNLLRRLRELKSIVDEHQQLLGLLSAVPIYINGLLTAQWMVFGIIQVRLALAEPSGVGARRLALSQEVRATLALLSARTLFSVLTFVALITYTFVRCDQLPRQMDRLRRTLFQLNISLTDQPALHQSERLSLQDFWSMYEQVDRLSRETNLKLTSSTYYSKQCLLLIFSREISLVLLYIQIIDIYSQL